MPNPSPSCSIATVDDSAVYTFPSQFSYKRFAPTPRVSYQPTAGGGAVRFSPAMVDSDSIIPWQLEAATVEEYNDIAEFFSAHYGETLRFRGYWGDVIQVKWTGLEPASVRQRLHTFSGVFRVIETESLYDDDGLC